MSIFWQWGELKNADFQNEQQGGFVENTPDAGIPFRRQKFTDIGDIIQGSVILSKIEYLQFMSWYNSTIKQGSISFQYYDYRINAYRTAKIMDKPSYSSNSTYFNVNVKMYLDPTAIYNDFYLVAEDYRLIAGTSDALVGSERLAL